MKHKDPMFSVFCIIFTPQSTVWDKTKNKFKRQYSARCQSYEFARALVYISYISYPCFYAYVISAKKKKEKPTLKLAPEEKFDI